MAMKSEILDVTPAMAAEWLEKNANFNRKARMTIVERYARDMVIGQWMLTHQGIAFDCKGRLIDGQHRLLAVVKANTTIKMVVVRDAPATAFDHVDLGFGRTTSDVFKAQGDGWISNEHIAMARFIECGTDSRALITNRSPFELREMVEAHRNAIEFVLQNMERKVRGVTIAPVLGAIGSAYYSEMDRVLLASFVRLLVSGIAQDPERDSTVILLREWLRDNSGASSSGARYEAFLKTQRVVKAYMTGEKLSKLYTPAKCVYAVRRRVLSDRLLSDTK